MGIEDIIKMFKDHGISGLIFAIVIFIITSFIKSQWFGDWWSKSTDKFIEFFMKKKIKDIPSNEISESDILNHDIFNYIDFWTYSKVPTFQFSTDYRTVVFKKYLTIFLKGYKKSLFEFVQSKEYQNMDQSQLWKSLLNLINKIVYEYEKECEEQGIPKIVSMKMKSKNNDTIENKKNF